jgi:hypothetical protein
MYAFLRNLALALLLSGTAIAASDTIAELKAKADSAHGGDQAKYSLAYAHRMLEEANNLFTSGDVEKAQADIQEVMLYTRKATDAATSSGKHMKQTEIGLRELSKRMHDVATSLAVEDRPPLREAVDTIEQLRSQLLARMFGIQTEKKEKS